MPRSVAARRCFTGRSSAVHLRLPCREGKGYHYNSCAQQGAICRLARISRRLIQSQIDLPAAQPEIVAQQIQSTFGIDPADIIQISAKTGKGVEKVLQAIVDRIPPPVGDPSAPLKAFLFDSS